MDTTTYAAILRLQNEHLQKLIMDLADKLGGLKYALAASGKIAFAYKYFFPLVAPRLRTFLANSLFAHSVPHLTDGVVWYPLAEPSQ